MRTQRGWARRTWPSAEKYIAFVRISRTHARRDRGELYGRAMLFAVILGVLLSLWRAARESGLMAAAAPKALLRYVAATEWILLSTPLLRTSARCSRRGLGVVAARAPVLAVVACLCAFAFTGWIPPFRVLALSGVFMPLTNRPERPPIRN